MIDFLIFAGRFWLAGAAICGGLYLLLLLVEAVVDNVQDRFKGRGKY